MDLRGAVAVVTGASSGIGRSTAWAFAREGSTVVAAARREDRLKELIGEIERQGGRGLAAPCDVSDRAQVEALAGRVREAYGRCDVLVNSAGVPQRGSFPELSVEALERITRINFLGVLYCTKAFLPMMLAAGHGHVVNVASMAGRFAAPGSSVYSATKHAVVALSESLHFELAPKGLRITAVNPGFVETEGFPHAEGIGRRPGLMKPEAIADLIVRVARKGIAPEISKPRWMSALQAVRLVAPPVYRLALREVSRREADVRRTSRPSGPGGSGTSG